MERHAQSIFGGLFVLLSLVALLTMGARAPAQEGRPENDLPATTLTRDGRFLRGVALPLYHRELYRDYEDPLEEIAELGSDTVSLVVTWSQRNIRDTAIGPDPEESRPDEVVAEAIEEAHEQGLRVMLFPILKISERSPGEWRGTLMPADVIAWFHSYSNFILHYAALAAEHGVEVFSVGSELGSMEVYEEQWRTLIAAVRAVYPGRLLYSANWDHYPITPFWDAVDLAGLTAYYELTDALEEPVVLQSLVKAWEPIRAAVVGHLGAIGRPIVFTEVGYYSQPGTAWHPWDYTRGGPVDLQQQYLCYRAFYEVWRDVPELGGVFFWHWWGEGGPDDGSYTPREKPAAEVIVHWFSQWPPVPEVP